MPLSDREQRMLEEMERGLSARSARRVTVRAVQSRRPRRITRGVLAGLCGSVLGLVVLYLGLRIAGAAGLSRTVRDVGTGLGVGSAVGIWWACCGLARAVLGACRKYAATSGRGVRADSP
jgi:hypothetical protein